MKVSKLEGDKLDYWIAMANDWGCYANPPKTSESWNLAGQIIEREKICIGPHCTTNGIVTSWKAGWEWPIEKLERNKHCGPTPLIAAMRAYVSSKYGDEVEE